MNVKPSIYSENNTVEDILKSFRLLDIYENLEEQIKIAVDNNLSHREFLENLLHIEHQGKKERRKERNIKAAKFEKIATLEEFDFSFQKSINMAQIKELATLNFLEKNENIILIGPNGVGKSHISQSIGLRACEEGKKVLFTPAIELIERLETAYEEGKLKEFFKKLSRIDLLIIDEFSHFKMNKEKESIFFQLIRQRYEKSSLIITTNIPLGSWDHIFTSKLAATAVLDRLVHHCHVISIPGDSYRVKAKIKEDEFESQRHRP
ncbi:DNA replication protein DnaC [Desulfitispora alkaliphila]|uniref:IS21-like element helper ATPase IstB n=1 Tax=Desulfitispora alkaliphila TaxID=622674 RepID=UPI003D197DA0